VPANAIAALSGEGRLEIIFMRESAGIVNERMGRA
jgi:hypothetical protein